MTRVPMPLTLALAIAVGTVSCGKKEEPPKALAEVVCSYAPSQSAIVGHVSGLAGGSAAAAGGVAKAAGLTAVAHSSGAYIFTGPAGYLAGTLGTAITLPVIVTVGAAVGGSAATLELVCAPQNHPEFVAKVYEAAKDFKDRYDRLPVPTVEEAGRMAVEVKGVVAKAGNEAFEYANRKSVEVTDAVRKMTQ